MRVLKHNWPVKLLALLVAVVLFVYVRGQQDRVRSTLFLPVIIPAPTGQRVVEPSAGAQVRVDLEGPAEIIRSLDSEQVKLNIDTSGVKPGTTVRVPVAVDIPENLRNRGLEAVWRPQSIRVKLISDATRRLAVEVEPTKEPEGWELTSPPQLTPAQVTISGSNQDVGSADRVVAHFPLEPTERISALVPVQVLDASGTDITDQVKPNPAQVLVSATQERMVLQKDVPVQPVFRAPPGMRVTARVTPARVRLIGPEARLGQVYVVETAPFEMPPGRTQFTKDAPLVSPGEGIVLRPDLVRVEVKAQPLAQPRTR